MFRRKTVAAAAVLTLSLIVALLLIGGCGGDPAGDPAAGQEKVAFTDSVGREVEVPAEITRIVPSGTMAQIVLLSLAPDKLVGLAERWSPDAAEYLDEQYYNLPVLGQFYGGKGDHNLEEIARVDPQLIIDVGEPKPSIADDLDGISAKVDIPAVHITATLETMGEAYRILGELLGMEEEATVLADYCEEVYSRTQEIAAAVGEAGAAKLLYCTGDKGLNVIPRGSFLAEIVDLVSDNVAVVEETASKGTDNAVDLEQILLWDPEMIIFGPDSIYDTVAGDTKWQELTAVKEGRYYEVPAGPYNWMGFPPSVNRYMGMVWLTKLLYPAEAAYDGYAETARYYKLFYHCELTEEQYTELVARSF